MHRRSHRVPLPALILLHDHRHHRRFRQNLTFQGGGHPEFGGPRVLHHEVWNDRQVDPHRRVPRRTIEGVVVHDRQLGRCHGQPLRRPRDQDRLRPLRNPVVGQRQRERSRPRCLRGPDRHLERRHRGEVGRVCAPPRHRDRHHRRIGPRRPVQRRRHRHFRLAVSLRHRRRIQRQRDPRRRRVVVFDRQLGRCHRQPRRLRRPRDQDRLRPLPQPRRRSAPA